MKFNLKERLKGTLAKASLSSKVLFVLTVVCGAVWLLSNLEEVWFLATGLMGVLWLSSIALHSLNKRGRSIRFNPFTPLIALCAALFILCQYITSLYRYNYDADDEPINIFSRWLQEEVMDAGVPLDDPEQIRYQVYPVFGSLDHNLIITDADNKVVYSQNTWKTGKTDTVRALVCPSTFYGGNGLMILMDGKENVLASFAVDKGYIVRDPGQSGSSLTIADSAAARDPLYERYFPSFGTYIDKEALALSYTELLVYEGEDARNVRQIEVGEWTTENIYDIAYDVRNSKEVAAEMSALTSDQRESLKAYFAWLSAAREGIRTEGYGQGYRSRIFTSPDGEYHAYLLYEYDDVRLTPFQHRYWRDNSRMNTYRSFSYCMIPAAIVFLAFWVFVDARKRGQRSPALWAVLTLIGNVITWIIYLITRPQMGKTVAGQTMPKGSCPICGTKLRNEFIACPGCGILIRNRCKNCGRALENDWSFCPYCTQAVVKEIQAAVQQAEAQAAEEVPAQQMPADAEPADNSQN